MAAARRGEAEGKHHPEPPTLPVRQIKINKKNKNGSSLLEHTTNNNIFESNDLLFIFYINGY